MHNIELSHAEISGFDDALLREWLVTNGIGGFAGSSVGLARTRRYHGLLVAALNPPVGRTVMVAKMEIRVRYAGKSYALTTNEYTGGSVDPSGHRWLASFHLDGTIPVWTWSLGDGLLEQRVWMDHGLNTTRIRLRWQRGEGPAELELIPLCTWRDYHAQTHGGWPLAVDSLGDGCRVRAFDGASPYEIRCDRGNFEPASDWHWRFLHRLERERGLDDSEDLFCPGRFALSLADGENAMIVLTSEPDMRVDGRESLIAEKKRQAQLLKWLPVKYPDWVARLALAADQYLVRRGGKDNPGTSVIAGYPWFSDWGRDTMIALPGLTLATGRPELAADVLRTFARFVSEGMLPNRFPDAGEAPEYNTVDATLWYFDAIDAYDRATGDSALIRELFPVLIDIIDWHVRGTRYGICRDDGDGLLFAGEPGVQLTWMDAKVGDWVVTPRIGKPVEVNALWLNALAVLLRLAQRLGDVRATNHIGRIAASAAANFTRRFWFAQGGYFYDVIDGVDGAADASLRPNQIFAISLPNVEIANEQARAIVEVVARELFTPVGLRSLATTDPRYAGQYLGGPRERDGVYHQGTVWSWLLGPFARAHYRVHRDAATALSWLDGLYGHLREGCIGQVSEIFDGDAPFAPRGCFAQAWGVAEPLRAWHEIVTHRQSRPRREKTHDTPRAEPASA